MFLNLELKGACCFGRIVGGAKEEWDAGLIDQAEFSCKRKDFLRDSGASAFCNQLQESNTTMLHSSKDP